MTSFDFDDSEMRILLLALDLCHRARIEGPDAEPLRMLLVKAKNPPPSLADEHEALEECVSAYEKEIEDLRCDIEGHLGRIKELEEEPAELKREIRELGNQIHALEMQIEDRDSCAEDRRFE